MKKDIDWVAGYFKESYGTLIIVLETNNKNNKAMEKKRRNGIEIWRQRLQRVADNAIENAVRQAKKYLREFILKAEYQGELVYDVSEGEVEFLLFSET